ncbi:MAG: septation ring formation regulator EzrA [Carnobacterium sp.]|uniref:septation ring formation regulator EzrA n=1 Tax=Carnobacterium TaxID=2747 RepID=UPI0012FBDE61|nr:septation ring formation regulator EzrA [Carnobacterium maltaromaticum]CAD5901101.1 Septation ring formation regulator EzrA [Carnobacterium maltaromaticum]
MNVIVILIVIIVLALVLYGASYFLKKKHYHKIDELENRKLSLTEIPVIDEINKLKKLQLTGQTEKSFKEWEKVWRNIATVHFPDIENYLFDAEQATDRMKLVKAQQAEDAATKLMDDTQVSIDKVQAALKKLIQSEEENRLEIKKTQEIYQNIRKKLLTQSFSFGGALENLERRLTYLELDFTKFSELTTSGDHIEAREVLERVATDTAELDRVVGLVPTLLKTLTVDVVDQVTELKEGHAQLLAENFVFLDSDIPAEIKTIEENSEAAKSLTETCEVDEAQKMVQDIETNIDKLYDLMQDEIDAKAFVNDQQKMFEDYLTHVIGNNRKLLIEIDRVAQSYTLNHDELEAAKGIETELDTLKTSFDNFMEDSKNNQVVYSVLADFFEETGDKLTEIEEKQQSINSGLLHLRKDEMEARKKLDEYEFEMRAMKRYVEKQHLPGLPEEYLDLFFSTTKRIEELAQQLNKLKVDMKEISRLCFMCQDDVTLAKEKTEEIVDSALLTEYMMQYANRYRHSNESIADAIDSTLRLFNKDYRYQEALETISTALELVEAGAYKKVEDNYYADKKINQ